MTQIIRVALLMFAAVIFVGAQDISTVEQRSEALRAQLRSVVDKQAELQARLTQLEEDLKPENIQRTIVGIGTTDANALRDQRQQQLEREKAKLEEQMRSLDTSRTRLEASIASADAEAIRQRAAALAPPRSNDASTQATAIDTTAEPSTVQAKKRSVTQTKKRRTKRARRRSR